MSNFEFHAMGTEVEAWAEPAQEPLLRSWFELVEACCSRFRDESELMRLNRDPSSQVRLDGLLLDVIRAGAAARVMTDGLVDIGVGGAVTAWGYDRTFEEVSDLDEPPIDLSPGEWSLVDDVLRRGPAVRFDLGGIAKGWTCDRAVERGLAEVVSAGGDLRSGNPETTATVYDPSAEPVFRLHVGVGALATSSIGRRHWRVGGLDVSHIIDPRSMRPVDTPVVSATVVAKSAVDAETGAKAVLLHGADGLEWAAGKPWIDAAVVQWHDGSIFGTPGLEVAA